MPPHEAICRFCKQRFEMLDGDNFTCPDCRHNQNHACCLNFLTYGQGGANPCCAQLIDRMHSLEAERDKYKAKLALYDRVLEANNKEICWWCANYSGEYDIALADSEYMNDFIDYSENKEGEKVRVCDGCAESADPYDPNTET